MKPGTDSREQTAARAERELADPGEPELAPPVPAGALAAHAARAAEDERSAPDGRRSRRDGIAEILGLAWPVMGSQILLSLTGLADRMMVGRLAEGDTAAVPLAAIGYASQLFFLIQSTLIAVGLACVALMARAIGAGRPRRARDAFAASVQIAGGVTLLYSAGIYLAGEPILVLLGAEPAVIEMALPYLHLTLAAALLLAVSLMVESALRADRDPRTPMFVAVGVTFVKIGLNAVFIFGLWGSPRLGVVGAGLATLLSQALGLLLFVAVLARTRRDAPTGLRIRDLARANPSAGEVVRISLPSIAERIVLNLGLLSFFWILSRWYGTLAVAVYTVGIALLSFSWIPGTGYAQACATLVGQALGAERLKEASRVSRRSVWLAIGTAIPLGGLCAWWRRPLAQLFTDDASVIDALGPFMLTLAFAQPFLQLHFTLAGAHKGAGDTVTPLVAALIGNWAVRIPVAILVAGWLEADVVWVWIALIFDHLTRSIHLGASFLSGRWRKTRLAIGGAEGPRSDLSPRRGS